MKLNRLEVLSKDEIKLIHDTTLELLQNIGVKVESQEARNFLKNHGAVIDGNNKEGFVKFPKDLIIEQLKKVPESFTLHGPDGSFHFNINTKNINFTTFGATVNMYDPEKKKKIRKTKLQDAINHIRVVNGLEHIVCSQVDVWPHDIPYTQLHFYTIREWGRHSIKPYGMACFGRTASQDMMNLTSIIVGGEDELVKHPRLIGVFNPTSPLRLTQILLNGLFIFAKYNQPILISAAASAGSTSPVTLCGTLVQANMEVLTSIVLTQLINPGTPVLYGSTNTIMDPFTGNVAYGAMEFGLLTISAAQLAHFYNIPSKGSGALTDSKCFDIQNGYERFNSLLCAANAGHNLITCAGTYESTLSEALELLVIDDEMAGIIKRGIEGIRVNDENLALNEIKKVANEGKNYLMLKHTAKNTRKELFVPNIVDRNRREAWIRTGSKDMVERARKKVENILETQKGPGLSPQIEEKLNEYFKVVATRTLDDYRKLENMEDSDTPSEISGIKIE
ncbi:MAG: trimethylamine methyltransferase family protein [Candidatus Thorarchaeota archaeon]